MISGLGLALTFWNIGLAQDDLDSAISRIVEEVESVAGEWITQYTGTGKDTYLGVTLESVPDVLRDYIDLPKGVGLLLPSIAKDGPAQTAGIEPNDILVEFEGQLIVNHRQLSVLMDLKQPGDVVTVKVLRKGEMMEFKVTLGERSKRSSSNWRERISEPDGLGQAILEIQQEVLGNLEDEKIQEIIGQVEEWIPGSVRVFVDDEESVHVDLSELKENVEHLKAKVALLKEGQDWENIIFNHGDAGARQTVVRMEDKEMHFKNSNGEVLLNRTENGEHVMVWDQRGTLIYEGPLQEDLSTLPEEAQSMIRALRNSFQHLDLKSKAPKIELSTENSDPLTQAEPSHSERFGPA